MDFNHIVKMVEIGIDIARVTFHRVYLAIVFTAYCDFSSSFSL